MHRLESTWQALYEAAHNSKHEALALLEKLIVNLPDDPTTIYNRGLIKFELAQEHRNISLAKSAHADIQKACDMDIKRGGSWHRAVLAELSIIDLFIRRLDKSTAG